MLPDPASPLSLEERRVFGDGAVRHAITGLILETGSGALPPRLQAYGPHLDYILATEGKQAAEQMRAKLLEADRFVAEQKTMAAEKLKLETVGVSATAAQEAQK